MEKITILRERLGLSQVKFAEELGVTQASVSRWERNDVKELPEGAAARVVRVFNVSPDWLAGKDAPMFITDGTSDAAPKVTPYAFFLSQGFGKITSRFFAALCGLDKKQKDFLENACKEKNLASLEFLFQLIRNVVLHTQKAEQGEDDGEDAPVIGDEHDGDDAPVID